MHHAAGNDYPEVLKYLVEHGANKESLAENGDRPLHSAAQWGGMNAAEALLNIGVDIESKNNSGNRPLNLACIAGRLEMVKFLVRRGADLEGPWLYVSIIWLFCSLAVKTYFTPLMYS